MTSHAHSQQIRGYAHPEAFTLMWYEGKAADGSEIRERIWNSRDGVTPFIVRSRTEPSVELTHAKWATDVYDPSYAHTNLKIGDRVFVDMTHERATEIAAGLRARWEREWTDYLLKRWAGAVRANWPDPSASADVVRYYVVGVEAERGGSELSRRTAVAIGYLDESVEAPPFVPPTDEWDEIIEARIEEMTEPGTPALVVVDADLLTKLQRTIPRPDSQMHVESDEKLLDKVKSSALDLLRLSRESGHLAIQAEYIRAERYKAYAEQLKIDHAQEMKEVVSKLHAAEQLASETKAARRLA